MRIPQAHKTASRHPSVVNAGDPWDPASDKAAILMAPFGEFIPSSPLLVPHRRAPMGNLGHIRANAIVREARLRASIESALYRPLPRQLSYLSRLPDNIRIGLVDDQLVEPEATSTRLIEFASEDWLLINSSGLPIAGAHAFGNKARSPLNFRRKKQPPCLPMLRYCSLIIGDLGPVSRAASLLDIPVLPAGELAHQLEDTSGMHDLASAHGRLIKERLLTAYPIQKSIGSSQALTELGKRTRWSIAPTSSSDLFPKNGYTDGSLPQSHVTEAVLLSASQGTLPCLTERHHRILFKLQRKSRKLINDPYAFFTDMKIPLLR